MFAENMGFDAVGAKKWSVEYALGLSARLWRWSGFGVDAVRLVDEFWSAFA